MVAVQVAISLSALTGVLALAVDAGLLFAVKWQAQAAADAGALAAAADLYKGNGVSAAKTSAQDLAVSNKFTRANVVVNVPPSSGAFTNGTPGASTNDKNSYVEVIATYNQGRYFSNVFGGGTIAVTGRAVARGQLTSGGAPAVLILDPNGSGAITDKGGGNAGGLTVTGGAVVVNSTSTSAINTTGHATLTAPVFNIAGSSGSGNLTGTVNYGVSPTPDPLAYLPPPSQPAKGDWYVDAKTGNIIVPPGAYGIDGSDANNNLSGFKNGDSVLFQGTSAGKGSVVYLASGGLGGNNVTYGMDPSTSGGIMIYNASTSSSDTLSLGGNGNSQFNLTAPTSGTYAGISIFQNRSNAGTISMKGNGSSTIQGTVYAPNATLSLSGNGSATVGSQLIVQDLSMNGNGNATVSYTATGTAPTRQLQLVE